MIRFLADEHIPPSLVRAIQRDLGEESVVEVRATELRESTDSELLEWAAENDYVVLTYDKKTLVPDANARVAAGQKMPGVIVMRRGMRVDDVVIDLVLIAECGTSEDLKGQVHFVPLA